MALPDARFNLVSQADLGNARVFVEWHLVASPAVSLAGCDLLVVEQQQLRSVQRHFDRQTLRQQMGEDAWSSRVSSGNLTPPGAFSLTWIDFRPEDLAHEQKAQYGPRIVGDLMRESGVITWLAAGVSARWFTITAWEDVDRVQKGMGKNAAHQEALRQFSRPTLAKPFIRVCGSPSTSGVSGYAVGRASGSRIISRWPVAVRVGKRCRLNPPIGNRLGQAG